MAALCLCLSGAAVSALLLMQHHGEGTTVSAVNRRAASADGGCEDVARSSWSRVAGVPVAAYGLAFYLSLALALALSLVAPAETRDALAGLALAALAVGLLVDVLLLGVQAFAIHAYCKLCILTYVLSALALVALLPPARRRAGRSPPRAAGGRLALAGSALDPLAVAGAVFAANATLRSRPPTARRRSWGRPPPRRARRSRPRPRPRGAPATPAPQGRPRRPGGPAGREVLAGPRGEAPVDDRRPAEAEAYFARRPSASTTRPRR